MNWTWVVSLSKATTNFYIKICLGPWNLNCHVFKKLTLPLRDHKTDGRYTFCHRIEWKYEMKRNCYWKVKTGRKRKWMQWRMSPWNQDLMILCYFTASWGLCVSKKLLNRNIRSLISDQNNDTSNLKYHFRERTTLFISYGENPICIFN